VFCQDLMRVPSPTPTLCQGISSLDALTFVRWGSVFAIPGATAFLGSSPQPSKRLRIGTWYMALCHVLASLTSPVSMCLCVGLSSLYPLLSSLYPLLSSLYPLLPFSFLIRLGRAPEIQVCSLSSLQNTPLLTRCVGRSVLICMGLQTGPPTRYQLF